MNEFTSIIVCTYNRSPLLARFLETLSHYGLDNEHFEVIVVNDGSTDNTEAVCHTWSQRLPNFRGIASDLNQGVPAARNKGISAARGSLLLFTDDDCIPRRDWAERMVSALRRHPAVAGAIASARSPYLVFAHHISQCYHFMPHRPCGSVLFMAGANMGIRRSVLERVSGFDEDCRIASDTEMALRLRRAGTEIYFQADAIVRHDPGVLSLGEVLRYAASHAERTIRLRHRFEALLGTPWVLKSPTMLRLVAPLIAVRIVLRIYVRGPRDVRFLSTLPVVFAAKLAWCFGAARGLA